MDDRAKTCVTAAAGEGHEPAPWAEDGLQRLAVICRDFRLDPLQPQIDALADMLKDGGVVDVAVVGRFKAGKSSFLNSLIGADVMPVAVLPLTSVVTRLRYGPRERAVVRSLDGAPREIPLSALAEYVTESGNPRNARQVGIVDVETPALRHYRGVRFVDTPGLGSVFAHNTRTSMEWLPRVGAALLAVSVDQPLSEHDVTLLRELTRHTPEIAVLLTKADLVTTKELDQVSAFIARQVGAVLDPPPPILPWSARPGHDALRQAAQAYLLQRVAARHEERSEEILRYKLRALLSGCRRYLDMARSSALAAQDARIRLQEMLRHERRTLATVRDEIWLLNNDLKGRMRDAAIAEMLAGQRELTQTLADDLRRALPDWRGNLAETTAAFEAWAQDSLRKRLAPLSDGRGRALAAARLVGAQESFTRIVRAFQGRLAEAIRRCLGIAFEGAAFEASPREPRRPDIRIGRVFDTPVELLWFLVPMFLARPLVNRHFLRRLPWEVEKNLHRLAAQWSEAVGQSMDELCRQAQEFIRHELDAIEDLVARSQDRLPAIQQALAALDTLSPTMESVPAEAPALSADARQPESRDHDPEQND